MKTAKRKRKRVGKNIVPYDVTENAEIREISREFVPANLGKVRPRRPPLEGEKWVCPLCERPHHKKPGPFTCGVKIYKRGEAFYGEFYDDEAIGFWVESAGCCRDEQGFPLTQFKEGRINTSNLAWFLRKDSDL